MQPVASAPQPASDREICYERGSILSLVASMPVSFSELRDAFDFVNLGGVGLHQAFLCKQSGRIYWHSEDDDELDEVPVDIGDDERYLAIPDKRELGLGKPLVLDFDRQFLVADADEIRRMFSKKGAYAKFKHLLGRRGALKQWHEFEAKAQERELRSWCELNSIELTD